MQDVEAWAVSVNEALAGVNDRLTALEKRQRALDNTASLRGLALVVVIVLTAILSAAGALMLPYFI